MLINEVAKKYNTTVRTLRYYEELGLLELSRNNSNIRIFSIEQLNILEDILLLKTFNFSLHDITKILQTDNGVLKDYLCQELHQIKSNIQELTYKKRLIQSLLHTYGSTDITKKNLKEFAKEQMYFKNERIITMITKAENIILEISENLIPLATSETGISLIPEIKSLRKHLKESNNIVLDTMHIKDNLDDLKNFEFQLIQNGSVILKDSVKDEDASLQVKYIISKLKAMLEL